MISGNLKNFDWRSLQKYTSPQAAHKLNTFLESIPHNTGQTLLVITGVVWLVACTAGLFTTVQLKSLTELRAELQEMKALKPAVPEIKDTQVGANTIKDFVEQTRTIYTGLNIKASGTQISVSAGATAQFGQFREAIGHIQNGGSGWRVNIDKLCVGRECKGNPLSATLKINKVSVAQNK
jgi:hypothetical protein